MLKLKVLWNECENFFNSKFMSWRDNIRLLNMLFCLKERGGKCFCSGGGLDIK